MLLPFMVVFHCIMKAPIEVQTSPCCTSFKTLKMSLNTMAENQTLKQTETRHILTKE